MKQFEKKFNQYGKSYGPLNNMSFLYKTRSVPDSFLTLYSPRKQIFLDNDAKANQTKPMVAADTTFQYFQSQLSPLKVKKTRKNMKTPKQFL